MANSVDPDQTAPVGQSVLGPRCLLLYLIHQLCLAIICSRRLQQTTFSDAFLAPSGLKHQQIDIYIKGRFFY